MTPTAILFSGAASNFLDLTASPTPRRRAIERVATTLGICQGAAAAEFDEAPDLATLSVLAEMMRSLAAMIERCEHLLSEKF